jgi:hypothetical protein
VTFSRDPTDRSLELTKFHTPTVVEDTATEVRGSQRGEHLAVRSLYHDGMVRIVVTPTWAKLIDFETTLPSAVEELVRQREERQHR